MKENLLLKIEEFEKLVDPSGGCIVSSRICIDGIPISFMYKEYPDDIMDSGWRFLSGDEDDEYLENPANSGIYDLNTVANFDKSIIPYLELPINTALIRNPDKENSDVEFIPLEE